MKDTRIYSCLLIGKILLKDKIIFSVPFSDNHTNIYSNIFGHTGYFSKCVKYIHTYMFTVIFSRFNCLAP